MKACETALATAVGMLTLACMNHAISDKPPFYHLQYATHWFLLMSISAFVAKTDWWTAAVSSFGVQIFILHWSLVMLGVRPPPNSSKVLQNLNCYLVLPIIMIWYACHANAYTSALSDTITSTAVINIIITSIICVHDRISPNPVYPNLPLPVAVLSLGMFSISTVWLISHHNNKS